MRKLIGVLAVAVLLVGPAVAQAYTSWSDDFSSGTPAWGTGYGYPMGKQYTGGAFVDNAAYTYQPGANYFIAGSAAKTLSNSGAYTYAVRTGYTYQNGQWGTGTPFANVGTNVTGFIRTDAAMGPGTYTVQTDGYRSGVVFGVQNTGTGDGVNALPDSDNYFRFVTHGLNSNYAQKTENVPAGIVQVANGSYDFYIMARVNGVDYMIGAVSDAQITTYASADYWNATVRWNPTNAAMDIGGVSVPAGGIIATMDYTWNTGTTPTTSTVTVTANDANLWNDGYFGGIGQYVDSMSYTAAVPEPATMAMLVLGGIGVLARRRRK